MTFRQTIDTAYAIAVEELRDLGMSLYDATAKIDEIIRPRIPVEVDPMAERIHRAKQNVSAYARLSAATGAAIGRRRVKAV
jgi:hypothetical protein